MQVKFLMPGGRIVDHRIDGQPVPLFVEAIQAAGRRFLVTFRSSHGLDSAIYPAEAYIAAVR